MSLIAGSYEKFIWGFKLKPQALTLSQTFSYPSHLSPIKSVAVSYPLAASSSDDDSIKLYDLSTSTELGSLLSTSSITSLSFFTPQTLSFPRNLISASTDGSVSIYDIDPFVLLKDFTIHKSGINDLAVHPSGRLALTVGRDGCLGMVNLVRGRRSFYCRLGKEAALVKFDLRGDRFFMGVEDKVSVHEAEDARILYELDCHKRVLCAAPGENGLLFTGGEDRSITAWDTTTGKVAYCINGAHSSRVKGIVVLSRNDGIASGNEDPCIVASASSDGILRVWDVRMAVKGDPNPLAEADTKSRLTCLAGSSFKTFRSSRLGSDNAQQEAGEEMEEQ